MIFIPESHAADWELLASGNGADGDAGRIGFWECALLKAPKYDSAVFVHSSRCGYGDPEDLYVTHEGRAYRCTAETLDECCEALGIPVPFDIRLSEKTGTIAMKGWSRACWLPDIGIRYRITDKDALEQWCREMEQEEAEAREWAEWAKAHPHTDDELPGDGWDRFIREKREKNAAGAV